MKILAVIPARGGSKGILQKNLKNIEGTTLTAHAIKSAKKSKLINRIIVSTDDRSIANEAILHGAEVPFMRPKKYAQDLSQDYEVFRHCIDWLYENENYKPDVIVQLRPTVPLRRVLYIDDAIEKFLENYNKFDSLRSVSEPGFSPYKMWEKQGHSLKLISDLKREGESQADMPRQSLPKSYAQDGYIDILKPETLYRKKSMGGDKIMGYFGHDEAYDIDNVEQLNEVRNIAKNKYINLQDKVQFNILRFGTLQGRLTDSKNKLQFFPKDWESEFFQANKLNLQSIEWLIEREESYINNPIIDKNRLHYLKKIIEESKVSIASVCADFIINKGLVTDLLKIIIQNLYLLNGEKLVLPLMGNSELTEKNIDALSQKIRNIAKFAKDFSIEISIESNKDPEIIKKLISMINLNNVGICFDLGNRNALSNDVVKELKMLLPYINHIHIKDKNKEDDNVLLGEGLTKFHEILKVLYINKYSNSLIFESIRNKDAISNMNENIKFIKEKLEVIECQSSIVKMLQTK